MGMSAYMYENRDLKYNLLDSILSIYHRDHNQHRMYANKNINHHNSREGNDPHIHHPKKPCPLGILNDNDHSSNHDILKIYN